MEIFTPAVILNQLENKSPMQIKNDKQIKKSIAVPTLRQDRGSACERKEQSTSLRTGKDSPFIPPASPLYVCACVRA